MAVALALSFCVCGNAAASTDPTCAESSAKCEANLTLSNIDAVFLKKVLHHVVPFVSVLSTGHTVALTGANADVKTALSIAMALDKQTPTAKDDKQKVDQICTIDNILPGAAQALATNISAFLNGSGPSPSASDAKASYDFSASNGSVFIDASQTKIFVHAPRSGTDALRLALKRFSSAAYADQVVTTYQVRNAIPDPIPGPSGTPMGAVSSVSGTTVGTSSVTDLAKAVSSVLTPAQGTPDIFITPDASFPRILLAGSRRSVKNAIDLLTQLDRRPPVIEFEATVYDIDTNAAQNLGVNFPTSISGSVGAYIAPPSPTTPATPGPLFAGKIASAGFNSFSVSLNTLLQNGAARVLSHPRVSTVNGRMAVIDVGQVIPFAPAGTTNIGGSGSGVVNYVIGTHLEMIPMVNFDGSISVYVHPINSTFNGFTSQNAPQFNRREMSASYRLSSGDAVFLSGLSETNDSDYRSQTPILNLIPFFGKHLLGGHVFNRLEAQLTISITAKLIDPGEYQYEKSPDDQHFDDPATPYPDATFKPLSMKCTWTKSASSATQQNQQDTTVDLPIQAGPSVPTPGNQNSGSVETSPPVAAPKVFSQPPTPGVPPLKS